MKTLIAVITLTIIALLTVGFVYPNEAPVFNYSHMLTSFYVIVAAGLAGVGLIDLKNNWNTSRSKA